MRIAIRADASTAIGSGHIMRCLALADELGRSGSESCFFCAELPDGLAQLISTHGHDIRRLDSAFDSWQAPHEAPWDWLVVDHYRLDARWESGLSGIARRVMVIDDLADRPHQCDVLLDQNDPHPDRYEPLVPSHTRLLLGSQFALLRSEFAALRSDALARRTGELRRILVFMGGGDAENETEKVLRGLEGLAGRDLAVDVVIGSSHPDTNGIQRACRRLPGTTLHVQTDRMAELICKADLAIGGGGGATWERCALGLPALVTLVAGNQREIATQVESMGAHRVLGESRKLSPLDYATAIATLRPESLVVMSECAAALCDGLGARRLVALMPEFTPQERAYA